MVDIHDRRPVVLNTVLWLDPALSPEQAAELARQAGLGPDAFEWYPVSTALNHSGAEDPGMAKPLVV